jgi:hypothetical protein
MSLNKHLNDDANLESVQIYLTRRTQYKRESNWAVHQHFVNAVVCNRHNRSWHICCLQYTHTVGTCRHSRSSSPSTCSEEQSADELRAACPGGNKALCRHCSTERMKRHFCGSFEVPCITRGCREPVFTVDWIHLAQDRVQCRPLVNTVILFVCSLFNDAFSVSQTI